MHPVLRLVEDHGVMGFENLLGHFLGIESEFPVDLLSHPGFPVVKGRKAMQEFHFGISGFPDHLHVYLIRLQ